MLQDSKIHAENITRAQNELLMFDKIRQYVTLNPEWRLARDLLNSPNVPEVHFCTAVAAF